MEERWTQGSSPTRSSVVLRRIVDALSTLGVDANALLECVGLDQRSLQALPPRIPVELQNEIWEEAVKLKSDPRIGIFVAAVLQADAYELLGGIARRSATLCDAVIRLARYGRLLDIGFDMQLEADGAHVVLAMPHQPSPRPHLQEVIAQLTTLVLNGRALTGDHLQVIEYRVVSPRPSFAPSLELLMEGSIRFGAMHNAVVLPVRCLRAAIPTVCPSRAFRE